MARRDILIHRDFPVVNSFVQVPPNNESDKSRVTDAEALSAIHGSEKVSLDGGSGRQTGGRHGAQAFIRLPGLVPGTSYSSNPVTVLAPY